MHPQSSSKSAADNPGKTTPNNIFPPSIEHEIDMRIKQEPADKVPEGWTSVTFPLSFNSTQHIRSTVPAKVPTSSPVSTCNPLQFPSPLQGPNIRPPMKRRPGRPPKYASRVHSQPKIPDFSLRKFFELGGRDVGEYEVWLKQLKHDLNAKPRLAKEKPPNGQQYPRLPYVSRRRPPFNNSLRGRRLPPALPRDINSNLNLQSPSSHQAEYERFMREACSFEDHLTNGYAGMSPPVTTVRPPDNLQKTLNAVSPIFVPPYLSPNMAPYVSPEPSPSLSPVSSAIKSRLNGKAGSMLLGLLDKARSGEEQLRQFWFNPIQLHDAKSPEDNDSTDGWCSTEPLTQTGDFPGLLDLSKKSEDKEEAQATSNEKIRVENVVSLSSGQPMSPDDISLLELPSPSRANESPEVDSSFKKKPISSLSVGEVAAFISDATQSTIYSEAFESHCIDGKVLLALSDDHMLGVLKMKLGHLYRLKLALKSVKAMLNESGQS